MEEKADGGDEWVNELMGRGEYADDREGKKPRLCIRIGLMSWWFKSPKAANQHEPGRPTSCCSFSPSSSSSSLATAAVVRACSFLLSLCRRAASAAANTPCVRFLARKVRFTLERVDFAIAGTCVLFLREMTFGFLLKVCCCGRMWW